MKSILFRNTVPAGVFMLAIGFFVLFFTGCDNYTLEEESVTPAAENVNSVGDGLEIFLASVDSLQQVYMKSGTRGSFWSGAGTSMADYIGYEAGRHIGRWVGGAVGSLSGNPFIAIAGVIVGAKAGSAICGAVASGAANMYLSTYPNGRSKSCLTLKTEMTLRECVLPESEDLGYLHNLCMVKILENADKYGYGFSINTGLMYDDIVDFYESYGISDAEIKCNPLVKEFIIGEIENLVAPSVQYELGNIGEETLISQFNSYLAERVLSDSETLCRFNRYVSKIAVVCSGLSENEISEFSDELNTIISGSSLNKEEKVEMAESANMIINSVLCWKEED